MADGWAEIKKQVTCSICLCVFREPKILPCLHTYCAKCLQTLWDKADRIVHSNKVRIRCLTCREEFQLSTVDKLQLNFFVSNLVDIIELQDKLNEEAPPTCQSCNSEEKAIASCVPCGVFMCGSCLGVHKRLRITSSHQVIGLDDIKSGKVAIPSILDHRQEMCPIHLDKPLELYCKEDKSFICLGCAVVKHRDHCYDFIAQVAKEQKHEIESTLPAFKKQLRRIKEATTEVKSMQEKIKQRKIENIHLIEQTFQEVIVALYKRKQQLVDEVDKTTADKTKALNEQHEKFLHLHAQMNSYLRLVESKLKSERDRAMIAMKDQMVNRGNSLSRAAQSTNSSPIETVPPMMEFPRLQNVTDLVTLLGRSFHSGTCLLSEITNDQSKPTFRVVVKDSLGQLILNCSSLLDVKIVAQVDPHMDTLVSLKNQHDVERPKIINKGNGCYEFSTRCNVTQPVAYYHQDQFYDHFRPRRASQKYGFVHVQLFGKDVTKSPLK